MNFSIKTVKRFAFVSGVLVVLFLGSCGSQKEGDCHSCPEWGYDTTEKQEPVDKRS